jgi:hypothetical protein
LWHPFRAKPVPWVPLGPARRHINPHNARVKAARVLCDAHKIYLKDSRANWLRHVRYLVKRGLWVLTAEQVSSFGFVVASKLWQLGTYSKLDARKGVRWGWPGRWRPLSDAAVHSIRPRNHGLGRRLPRGE